MCKINKDMIKAFKQFESHRNTTAADWCGMFLFALNSAKKKKKKRKKKKLNLCHNWYKIHETFFLFFTDSFLFHFLHSFGHTEQQTGECRGFVIVPVISAPSLCSRQQTSKVWASSSWGDKKELFLTPGWVAREGGGQIHSDYTQSLLSLRISKWGVSKRWD